MDHNDAMVLLRVAKKFMKRLEELGEKPLRGLSADELIALSGRTNLLRGRSITIRK
ncbi:MAG: hypothetical protein GF411_14845 [Candidatus Lokiarchaeota archaeon]|nr:hypothetical protein [Candidatus Lokiarchaeota archaeon]